MKGLSSAPAAVLAGEGEVDEGGAEEEDQGDQAFGEDGAGRGRSRGRRRRRLEGEAGREHVGSRARGGGSRGRCARRRREQDLGDEDAGEEEDAGGGEDGEAGVEGGAAPKARAAQR